MLVIYIVVIQLLFLNPFEPIILVFATKGEIKKVENEAISPVIFGNHLHLVQNEPES